MTESTFNNARDLFYTLQVEVLRKVEDDLEFSIYRRTSWFVDDDMRFCNNWFTYLKF